MAIRVFQLARKIGVTSKALLEECKRRGFKVASHMKALSEDQVRALQEAFKPRKAPVAPVSPEAALKAKKVKPVPKKPAAELEKSEAVGKPKKKFRKEDIIEEVLSEPVVEERLPGTRLYRRARKPIPQVFVRPSKITLEPPITVKDLSSKIGVKAAELIRELMQKGIMATINQTIPVDVAREIAARYKVEAEVRKSASAEESFLSGIAPDRPDDLEPRAPVVTLLGHVDHGKTSLLDRIRRTNVVATEAGNITQHIGAYRIERDGGAVVFLDTPGHRAFTEMRARGANVTDIVVLVVAADDGVMPQTEEAIDHARAANVPILVAVNKIDKPEANPAKVRQQLAALGLNPEEWGGQTIFVYVSALTGEGVDDLLEMLMLQAELLELKANPNRPAEGTVLEATISEGRGIVATVLVRRGTLRRGDVVVCGRAYGRVRSIFDDQGRLIKSAGPSMPVQVSGLTDLPAAGDALYVVGDLSQAKEIAEERKLQTMQEALVPPRHLTLENLFDRIKEGEVKELPVILKADVQGSLQVLVKSVNELSTPEVRVKILHRGVGGINESDVLLADASDAIIIGFQVVPEERARALAEEKKIDIRTYQVIYQLTEDMRGALEGLLEPEKREVVLGHASVRRIFRISRVGTIAGCYVTDGLIPRSARIRLIRESKIVHEGSIASLRHLKDDVREMREGFECGIRIEAYDDVKVGDVIEAYSIEKVARKLEPRAEDN